MAELSRRDFLKGIAAGALSVGVGAVAGQAYAEGDTEDENMYGEPGPYAEDTTSSLGKKAFIEKQYLPEVPAPAQTEYSCDVLVIGCGWAGLHAAVTAKKAGADVIVVDKGLPGFSGLSPFSQGATYFLKDFDDREGCMLAAQKGGEYIANLDWFDLWLDESAKVVEENREFGFMETYPTAKDSGY